jgi:oligopeptide transport system ATP-binding protein
MDNVILQVKDVKKYFPLKKESFFSKQEFLRAVDKVSFSVEKGHTFGLVGESGCGKSTLSRVITRLQEATEGQVLIKGQDIQQAGSAKLKAFRRQMQMVFQNPYYSLNPRMMLGELIEEPMIIHNIMDRIGRKKRVKELLETVGLSSKYMRRYPHEFSGGQRQRIGIARALALKPEILICDEPVSALDVSIQAQILNLLKDLQKELNLTCLFISHNLSVVKYMSQRIAVMYMGKIVEIADSEELYTVPKHPYTQALLSAIPVVDADEKKERIILTGDVPSAIGKQTGCTFRTRCWKACGICAKATPELFDAGNRHYVACHLWDDTCGVER